MQCVICSLLPTIVYNDMCFCGDCYKRQIEQMKNYEKHCVLPPTIPIKVTDKIFIGDKYSSIDETNLRSLNIKGIVVAGKCLRNKIFDGIRYIFLEIDDSLKQNLTVSIKLAHNFINCINGNVLVHCYSGISRSASIVISYLIKHEKMTYQNAYNYLKSKSPIIHPNGNFVKQLQTL